MTLITTSSFLYGFWWFNCLSPSSPYLTLTTWILSFCFKSILILTDPFPCDTCSIFSKSKISKLVPTFLNPSPCSIYDTFAIGIKIVFGKFSPSPCSTFVGGT
jgi:hypothetical protein